MSDEMDRDFAKLMMRYSDALDLMLGQMAEVVKEHGPDNLKEQMSRSLFKCVGDLDLDVRAPILRAFPDLHRDEE